MSKLAIDVSQWNGTIDWAKVAPQVSAAVIRLGYRGYGAAGTLALDPMYQRNMDGAIAAGLPVGVYWCSQALSDAEALEEARYCVDKLRGYKLQYPVLLDSEWMEPKGNGRADRIGKTRRTQYGLTWCRAMRDAGYIAGLYCSEAWYASEIDGEAFDREGFEIWLAKYSRQAPAYRCDAWQFTDAGRLSGISGNVDQNHVYADYGSDDTIGSVIANAAKDIGLDAAYWTRVLSGQAVASGHNIKALMDKYHIALLDADETVANAVGEISLDSPQYWLDVIEGRKAPSAANVRALMEKYHAAVASNT